MRKKGNLSELYINLLYLKDRYKVLVPVITMLLFVLMFCSVTPANAETPNTEHNSLYSVEEVADKDNSDYTIYAYQENTLTEKHYSINIDVDYLNTKYSYVTWSIQPSGLQIALPNKNVHLDYDSSAKATSRLTSVVDKVENLLFDVFSEFNGGAIYNEELQAAHIMASFTLNSASSNGGALYNKGSLGSLSSAFFSNSATVNGGAVYNSGSIAEILSDFASNNAQNGGAIYNETNATIHEMSSTFVSNYARSDETVLGGVIYNAGKINVSDSAFIGNYAYSRTSTSFGGAIYNVGEVTGLDSIVVIKNYARADEGDAFAGAIYNANKIGDVSGDFLSNYVKGLNAQGGAIYNASGAVINKLSGEFNNNSANILLGVGNVLGGAIYNAGTISEGIVNSSFLGNYAISSSAGNALGGAIYTSSDLKLVADDFQSVFAGNYTLLGDGTKNYNAIYVDFFDGAPPTKLIIDALNNGSFVFDDNISGKIGYYLEIGSSDNTGSIYFNSNTSIGNANVAFSGGTLSFKEQTFINSSLNLNGGNIDLIDNSTTQYIINKLSSSGEVETSFALDFNYKSTEANSIDFIRLLNASTQKVVICIDRLNVLYNGGVVKESDIFAEFSQPIVTKGMNVELKISEEIKNMPFLVEIVNRSVGIVLPEVVKFGDDIYEKFEIGNRFGYLSVNDNSIELRGTDDIVWTGKYDGEGVKVSGGTLNIINSHESTQKKVFLSEKSTDVYNVESDLGVSAKGDFAIYGVEDEQSISTIDMIMHSGFVIANPTSFEVKNIKFANAQTTDNGSVVNITNGDAVTNFEDVVFERNVSSGHGGALANTAQITNLIADFSYNRCTLNGAAVYNTGNILELSGDYRFNTTNSDRSNAGAVYNSGVINNIYDSIFANNSATVNGGAILNTGTIVEINADFSNNTTSYNGGAIVNRGSISRISGNFSNNGIRGSYSAQGGAILNVGTIDSIINSTFVGNYANISANAGSTLGGAIYTKSSINFIANNGFEMLFDGNYTEIGPNGKISSAIYVDNSDVTLLFDSRESSKIIVNDIISGANGYKILVNGDSTGFVGFYHFVTGAELELRNTTMSFSAGTFESMNVNLLSGVIDFLDDKAVNYRIKSLDIAQNVKFNIDIKSELDGNNICDTITVTDEANTSGTVFLDRINFDYEVLPTTDVYLKVLSGDSLELACNFDNIFHVDSDGNVQKLENKFVISKDCVFDTETVIPTTITFGQTVYKNIIETVTYGHFELYEWLEFDENLGRDINVKGLLYKVQVVAEPSKPSDEPMGDSLKLISNLQTEEAKYFIATEECNEYFVSDDVYDLHGNLTLKGIDENSVINFTKDGVMYNVFEMVKDSVLTVDTMKLTGNADLIFVKDTSAVINLIDANIDGDISSKNIIGAGRYNVNINGTKITTLGGMVIDANVTLNSGKLIINQGSLRFSNLILNGGLISCIDDSTATYDIEKITVVNSAIPLLDIDLDLNNLKSDVLNVQQSSSSGYIYINNIDIVGTVEDMILSGNQSSVITILSTSSSNLKLALTDKARDCLDRVLYEDVVISNEVPDAILEETNWTHIYNKTAHKEGHAYSLGLTPTERALQIIVSEVSGEFVNCMGDTLRLVNNDTTNISKTFVTDDSSAIYYVSENLGSTNNSVTVKGVVADGIYSTISLTSEDKYNTYSGFELEQNSTLKLDSVKVTGNDTLITVKDDSARIYLTNSYVDGDIVSDSIGYTVNVSNNFVMTGEFKNAAVISTTSNMVFGTNTFADTNTTLMLTEAKVNFVDNKYDNYAINKLSTDALTTFKFDLNVVSSKSDCITLNSFIGSKTIIIEEFNVVGTKEDITNFTGASLLVGAGTVVLGEKAIQQLEELTITMPPEKIYDESIFLSSEITWEDSKTTIYDISKKYSVVLNGSKTALELFVDEDIKESYTDEWTLSIFNQSGDYANKVYATEKSNIIQNIGRDLGETNGRLVVNGTVIDENISTINLGEYSGFVLGEKTTGLRLDSVKFVTSKNQEGNLVYATNNNATLDLNNVVVESSASEGSAIYTTGNLSISASNGQSTVMKTSNAINYVDVFVDGEGEKSLSLIAGEGSKVVLNSGVKIGENVDLKLDVNRIGSVSGLVQISLKGDLGSEVKPVSELNLNGGEFSVVDDVISNIYVETLNINENTIFDIDIDCVNNDADKIVLSTVLNTNSTGKKLLLSIDGINIINNEYKSAKFKLLNVDTATSDFVELQNAVGNSLLLGQGSDGFDYVLRLGLQGYIIIESNESFADNPLVLAINKTTSNTYTLSENVVINNYGYKDNIAIKYGEIQSPKFTLKGKNYPVLSTASQISGLVLSGTEKVVPKKQQFIASALTMSGFDGAVINKGGKVTLTSVGFVANATEQKGAAIRNLLNTEYQYSGSVSLKGTSKKYAQVHSNLSSGDGGAIYNEGTLTLQYVQFGNDTNGVVYNGAFNGGAVATTYKSTISSSKFFFNEAVENGGAIYTTDYLKSTSNIFEKNAANNGGAVYVVAKNDKASAVTLASNKFNRNDAKNGGAVFVNSGLVTISKSSFGSTEIGSGNNAAEYGGAIYNNGSKDTNKLTLSSNNFYYNIAGLAGGAIYNYGVFTDSSSSYLYNQADMGGAIYNTVYGDSVSISKSTFTSNIADVQGGAIYNEGKILTLNAKTGAVTGGITSAKFTSNTALSGGAVYNAGEVGLKSSTFTGNSAGEGGAIYNTGVVTSISSTYSANNADNNGGAVYNVGTLTASKSTFGKKDVKNKKGVVTTANNNKAQYGAGIYNEGTLVDTSSTFTNNTATVSGGALFNAKTANLTSTKFTSNIASELGGAIYNDEDGVLHSVINVGTVKVDDITKDLTNLGGVLTSTFTSNQANQGGAIYNDGVMTVGRSTFTSNSTYEIVKTIDADGNPETTNDITVETTYGYGGAIYNSSEKDSNKVLGSTFSKNTATEGGAIYNEGKLDIDRYDLVTISKGKEKHKYYNNSFTSNSADKGGAIYNASTTDISINYATFTSNKATNAGGAMYLADGSVTQIMNSTFTKNTATQGGAIYAGVNSTVTIIDTNFTNNTATEAGGAIYMAEGSEVSIYADAKDVTFSGNKVGTGKYKQSTNSNSIYMELKSVLNLVANEGRKITIKDKIEVVRDANNTENNPKINIGGAGTVYIYNETALSDLVGTLEQGSTMSLRNSRVGTTTFKGLNLDGTSNVELDASLKTGTADKVQAETVEGTGTLNVSTVNVVTNSKTPVEINVGKDSVVSSISTNKAESAEATYKLKSYYDENGLLRVVAYGQKAKSAAIAAPIAAQIGGYLAQINSYDQAFGNLDIEMLKSSEERKAEEMMNKYACASGCASVQEDNTINLNSKGLWNRAFATFEKVNLSGGPNVSNVGYGNYFGGDMGKKALSNGWSRQMSAYIGYNGSTQDYDRQCIDQNGGTIGLMETWYKGNFFTALTANVGGNNAQAHTDIGRENMSMLMAGVASKTGYNFEFKNGKFIVQPSLLVSYSFIHTFEHNNGLGHRVSSDPIHAIQVAPGVKFVANLKNGWQPYFGINMRWNIMDKSHFSIPDVTIPTMSVDPYVEYGFGVQKRWGDRFTGYGQAMVRNGGRNGVMLSIGFRWAIGK